MAKRIPVQTVVVVRDGKRVTPEIGKPYNFTDAEIADFDRLSPGAVRKPTNEAGDEAPAEKKPAAKAADKKAADKDEEL